MAYAQSSKFDGRWTWIDSNSRLNLEEITLQQDEFVITGEIDSKCGPMKIAGASSTNAIGVSFNIQRSSDECPNWIRIIAACNNDNCSELNGSWYDSNHLMGDLTWVKEDKNFYIDSPKPGSKFLINTEPRMPSVAFTVKNNNPTTFLGWLLKIDFHWRRGRTGAILPMTITQNTNEYTPNLTSIGILGGDIITKVTYDPLRKTNMTAIAKYIIYGSNPGMELIEQVVDDPIQRKIACVESAYRQFEASRENGVGLPVIGKNKKGEKIGGVGIMQIIHRPIISSLVWNWRDNLKSGLNVLNIKRGESTRAHIYERNRLNAERKQLGLDRCPKNIPPPLTSDQILRDSIRRYNYGVEYRWEPRNGKDCAGQWTIEPSCVRNKLFGCDENYTDKVLMLSLIHI